MASDNTLVAAQKQRKRVIGNPDKIIPYRYKLGQSGNPSGRPKGLIGAALFKQLRKSGGKDLERIVAGIIASATRGDAKAFAVIRDSTDGRPAQSIDLNAEVSTSLAERLERARKAVEYKGSRGLLGPPSNRGQSLRRDPSPKTDQHIVAIFRLPTSCRKDCRSRRISICQTDLFSTTRPAPEGGAGREKDSHPTHYCSSTPPSLGGGRA